MQQWQNQKHNHVRHVSMVGMHEYLFAHISGMAREVASEGKEERGLTCSEDDAA